MMIMSNLLKFTDFLSKIKKSIIFRIESKLFLEQWFLIFNLENKSETKLLKNFHKILPPKDRFWADPHIVFRNNLYYIFFEEFIYKQNKGHISYFTIDENGIYTKPIKILEQPFHLSYPFIFEYENELYMIPESQEKSIQLYKCLKFPEKWEFQKNLLTNISAADSTIFFHQNKWWMFSGIKDNQRMDWGNLCIFYADNPISDNWIPHQNNPIIKNISNSRPAGNFFIEDGNLCRPAQISTTDTYGKGIIINKINILNEKNYDEEPIKTIEPWKKSIIGIHTLNHVNNLTIFDAKWKIKK